MGKAIRIAAADLAALCLFGIDVQADTRPRQTAAEVKRPELNPETRALISAYRLHPTEENYARLRAKVAENYDRVLDRKRAKFDELRHTARTQDKIEEMEAIIAEMIENREARIDATMARFSDPRLRPGARTPSSGFVPVLGAGTNVFIAYTPVTNDDYAVFADLTGRHFAPVGSADAPAVNVSYADAVAYCKWLSETRGGTYRLPTAEEWSLAAGHMLKDLGSVQNQLQSTINNISVTQINVKSAKSQIRDVDFATEASNFNKYNILAQSGSYAMSQANTIQQKTLCAYCNNLVA